MANEEAVETCIGRRGMSYCGSLDIELREPGWGKMGRVLWWCTHPDLYNCQKKTVKEQAFLRKAPKQYKYLEAPSWCPLRKENYLFLSKSDTYESTKIRHRMRQEYWRCGQKK